VKKDALITIGLTAYNCADTIERALLSALSQDWPNVEIVVADDCSTDNTADIIRRYTEHHPAIAYYRTPENGGVAVARNLIIEKATGEFICFFDDDDESVPQRLAAQYTRLTGYEAAHHDVPVICHCARLHFYPGKDPIYVPTAGMDDGIPAPRGMAMIQRTLMGHPLKNGYGSMATCVQMARTDLYRRLGGFDAKLRRGEDTDLCLRAANEGTAFVGVAQPLVKQYMTLTDDKNLVQEKENWHYIFEKFKDVFPNDNAYHFCRSWLDLKFLFLQREALGFLRAFITLLLRHPVWTLKRVWWALPNYRNNRRFAQWRAGEKI